MTIIGQAGTVFIGNRMRFIQGQGWTTVSVYKSDTPADAQAFAVSNAGIGQNVDADLTRPPYLVEISTPSSDTSNSDEYVDRWEILPIEMDKSIFEHPVFQDLSVDSKNALRTYQKEQTESAWTAALAQVGVVGNGFDILSLLIKGTDHYQAAATSVRWTRTIGDGYLSLGAVYSSANKIWTSAQVIAQGPPALYASAISAAFSVLDSPALGYSSGWLKKQPVISQRGSNRSDIVTEWILENWSTVLYDNA